jgi:hypothetical protein
MGKEPGRVLLNHHTALQHLLFVIEDIPQFVIRGVVVWSGGTVEAESASADV